MNTLRALLFFMLSVSVLAGASSAQRLRQRLGPVTIHATPGKVLLANGQVIDRNSWGGSIAPYGHVYAIRNSQPGDVIGLSGDFGPIEIGAGDINKPTTAWQLAGQPIDVALVADDGVSAMPTILGVAIGDRYRNANGVTSPGGIELVTLCGLKVMNEGYSTSMIMVNQGANTGRLRVWESWLEPRDPASWGGHGSKWPIRAHGHLNGEDGPLEAFYQGVEWTGDGEGGGIEAIDLTIWPGKEHAYWYVDNIGPSRFLDIHRHPLAPTTLRSERTIGQITNRANRLDPVVRGGPSGYGRIEIARIESTACGGSPGQGHADGQAITVAGHLGPVWIHDITLRDYYGGAIAVWTDAAPSKGVWTFEDGKSTGKTVIENIDVESDIAQNPHISIGGLRSLLMKGAFRIKGPGIAIDIDNDYVGPIAAGPLVFDIGQTPSTYIGWMNGGAKVRRDEIPLTAQQIDALAVIEPTSKP